MIGRLASSTRPAKSAPLPVGWGRRESPIHGLRPVIGLLRVMPVRVNSPVRFLVASLR